MEEVFRFADDLGPLKLVHIHRSSIGLKAVRPIDNIACGPDGWGLHQVAQ
jgi:glutamate dehydrogenase (NAD(P)+)